MLEIEHIVANVHGRYEGQDLAHYYRLVMKAPNAKLPYHGVRHMLHVPWEAYDGGLHMGLGPRDLRNLIIAGLMHDYNHCGAKGDDSLNIDRSIRALHMHALDEDRPHLLDIQRIIEATRFPYESDRFDLPGLIMRDADQSQTFSVAWLQSIVYGLSHELEITPEQMLQYQIPFLEKLKFFTSWGRTKFQPLIAPRIEKVRALIALGQEPDES